MVALEKTGLSVAAAANGNIGVAWRGRRRMAVANNITGEMSAGSSVSSWRKEVIDNQAYNALYIICVWRRNRVNVSSHRRSSLRRQSRRAFIRRRVCSFGGLGARASRRYQTRCSVSSAARIFRAAARFCLAFLCAAHLAYQNNGCGGSGRRRVRRLKMTCWRRDRRGRRAALCFRVLHRWA